MRRISENIFITELHRISGNNDDLVTEIPHEVAGVYAFYKHYRLPAFRSGDSTEAQAYLTDQIAKPHMLTRQAHVSPIYQVTIGSQRTLSESKERRLKSTLSTVSIAIYLMRYLIIHSFFKLLFTSVNL